MSKTMPLTAFQFVHQRELFGSIAQQSYLEQYFFTDYRGTPVRVDVPIGARTVFFLVMSPDKSRFAAAHGDHTVRIYCATTGTLLSTKEGHPRSLWCLQFHPYNADILASSCLGGELRIWDLATSLDSVWRTKQGEVIASLSFHPKETLLAAATGTDIVFYNWQESQLHMIWRLVHPESKIRWLKFSSLGDALFTGICNRADGEDEISSPITNVSHPNNKNNLQSMYCLIRKKWTRMSTNLSPSQRSPNSYRRFYLQRLDNLSPTSSSTSNNLPDVARSLFSESGHYTSLLSRRRYEDIMEAGEQESCPVALIYDDDFEQQSPQKSEQFSGDLCPKCSNGADGPEDSVSPKRRKMMSASENQRSFTGNLSSVVDSLIPSNSSKQTLSESLNPDNSTFECLEMFKRQMDARDQSSSVSKSRPGRLEQQIYGSSHPTSSSQQQRSLDNSLFSRLRSPDTSSNPSPLNTSSSLLNHLVTKSSSDDRNRPRPVQVLPANALIEPPHPSSFVVRTAESRRLDTPIFKSPVIIESSSAQHCRQCGSPISSTTNRPNSQILPNQSMPSAESSACPVSEEQQSNIYDDSSLHANVSDPMWMALESRLVGGHPDYAVRILDETVNMAPPIRRMINQTLANVVFGREESALTTSLLDCTYKIQYWSFDELSIKYPGELSWISKIKPKTIIPSCKLHNDSSINLSSDSRLLAAFVPSGHCQDESVLSVYSCVPGQSMGHCLYTKKFGPNAISVEFSSANNLLLVGLASRRMPQIIHQRLSSLDETMGQVYRLHEPLAGEKSMRLLCNLHHLARPLPRSELSINGLIWSRNAGVIYATSAGSIFLMQAALNQNNKGKVDLLKTVGTQTGLGDDNSNQIVQPLPQ